ncbi:competence protein CoiA family protein [Streptomyces flavochromogenes]|uniref:Competence protein CoiA family protein n=1 Tax=Streptomyces flavochromogenes TaxID=68199 RepID=A0ABW6XXT7_9ACTN
MTPYADEEDTRKVQTAVIGRAGSDMPVFLPFEPDEFDTFMRGRSREDFYCGILLGGCGKKLTARRYTQKKCHFAHRPPVHCRRTANGESSADHLYIGKAILDWLGRHCGHPGATVAYPDQGAGPGGAIEIRFGGGSRLIRVQMGRLPLRTWEADRDRLARKHPRGAHWSYGPDSGLAHNEVDEHGHAIRFSCRTEGGTRKVYVGTQLPGHAVEWTTLPECRLTEDGIITPTLAARRSVPAPEAPALVAFPLQAGAVAFTGAVELAAHQADGTRLYEADVQPEGSPVTRARITLPHQAPVPPAHLIHTLTGIAHLIPLEDSHWLIRAEAAVALPHRTDPRWPDLRPPAPPRLVMGEEEMVALFREKLEPIHRSRGLINWETLIRHADAKSGDFTSTDRARILAAVDSPHTPGAPLLSAVVKPAHAAPGPAPFFADILARLGLGTGHTDSEVHRIWKQSIQPRAQNPDVASPRAESERHLNDEELVSALRQGLMGVAKAGGRIRWATLLERQGLDATSVSFDAQVRMLAAVDEPFKPGGAMLSALVKAKGTDGPAPSFEKVLTALGWRPSRRTPTVAAAWRIGRDRAYESAGRSPDRIAERSKTARVLDGMGVISRRAVGPVRQALVDAARRQVCVGWHTLAAAAGTEPGELSPEARRAILTAVDRQPHIPGVLLSSLVIGPGHTPVPYFDDILRALGRPYGLRPIELGLVRKTEQARAFAAYAPTMSTDPKEGP